MNTLLMLTETVAEEESEFMPFAIACAVTAFVLFAILLFAVTRLNPDR